MRRCREPGRLAAALRSVAALAIVWTVVASPDVDAQAPSTPPPAGVSDAARLDALLKRIRDEEVTFSIPPQSLATALRAFSEITGLAIIADQDMVSDAWSDGFQGRATPQDALHSLLQASRLHVRRLEGGIVIQPKPIERSTTRAPHGASAPDAPEIITIRGVRVICPIGVVQPDC